MGLLIGINFIKGESAYAKWEGSHCHSGRIITFVAPETECEEKANLKLLSCCAVASGTYIFEENTGSALKSICW